MIVNVDVATKNMRRITVEPMNPDEIAQHEPTAVKRDKNESRSGEPV